MRVGADSLLLMFLLLLALLPLLVLLLLLLVHSGSATVLQSRATALVRSSLTR